MGKRIFVTGGSGFLGSHLTYFLSRSGYEVWANYYNNPQVDSKIHFFPADFNRFDIVRPMLDKYDFEMIVHTAYDKSNENGFIEKSTENVLQYAGEKNIPVIHVSTDLVFSGKNGNYMEDDYREPISSYGRAKLNAEKMVEMYPYGCVVRTSLIYCINHRPPHYDFIQDGIDSGKSVYLHVDEIRNPVYVEDLVMFIQYLVDSFTKDTFHFAGPEPYSRFELGWQLTRVFNPQGLKCLRPATMEQTKMKRAANCTLSSLKARELSGIRPRSVSQIIKEKTNCRLSNKGKKYDYPKIVDL